MFEVEHSAPALQLDVTETIKIYSINIYIYL